MPTQFKIVNIVAMVTLSSRLDLELIHDRLPQTEIPGKSPWLKMRLPPDNTYIAFYKSGKFLITSKDFEKIAVIAEEVLKLLYNINLKVKIVNIQIVNIVVSVKIPLKVPLESIIVNLDPRKASFEPELFPALVYKNWGVNFLLFSTGSCIITGLKDLKDTEQMIKRLKDIIET